jgi:hypothetical protein
MVGRLGAGGVAVAGTCCGAAWAAGAGTGALAGAAAGTGAASPGETGDGAGCAAVGGRAGCCGIGAGTLTSGEDAGAFDGAAIVAAGAAGGDADCGVKGDCCGCSAAAGGGGGFSGCIEAAGWEAGTANGFPLTDAIMLLSTLTRASSTISNTKLSFSDATVPFMPLPFFSVIEIEAPLLKSPAGAGAAAAWDAVCGDAAGTYAWPFMLRTMALETLTREPSTLTEIKFSFSDTISPVIRVLFFSRMSEDANIGEGIAAIQIAAPSILTNGFMDPPSCTRYT